MVNRLTALNCNRLTFLLTVPTVLIIITDIGLNLHKPSCIADVTFNNVNKHKKEISMKVDAACEIVSVEPPARSVTRSEQQKSPPLQSAGLARIFALSVRYIQDGGVRKRTPEKTQPCGEGSHIRNSGVAAAAETQPTNAPREQQRTAGRNAGSGESSCGRGSEMHQVSSAVCPEREPPGCATEDKVARHRAAAETQPTNVPREQQRTAGRNAGSEESSCGRGSKMHQVPSAVCPVRKPPGCATEDKVALLTAAAETQPTNAPQEKQRTAGRNAGFGESSCGRGSKVHQVPSAVCPERKPPGCATEDKLAWHTAAAETQPTNAPWEKQRTAGRNASCGRGSKMHQVPSAERKPPGCATEDKVALLTAAAETQPTNAPQEKQRTAGRNAGFGESSCGWGNKMHQVPSAVCPERKPPGCATEDKLAWHTAAAETQPTNAPWEKQRTAGRNASCGRGSKMHQVPSAVCPERKPPGCATEDKVARHIAAAETQPTNAPREKQRMAGRNAGSGESSCGRNEMHQVPSAVCPERKPPGCATEDKVARHTAAAETQPTNAPREQQRTAGRNAGESSCGRGSKMHQVPSAVCPERKPPGCATEDKVARHIAAAETQPTNAPREKQRTAGRNAGSEESSCGQSKMHQVPSAERKPPGCATEDKVARHTAAAETQPTNVPREQQRTAGRNTGSGESSCGRSKMHQVPSPVCPERKPPGCATEDKVARHTAAAETQPTNAPWEKQRTAGRNAGSGESSCGRSEMHQVPSPVCPERKPPGCATEDKVARHTAAAETQPTNVPREQQRTAGRNAGSGESSCGRGSKMHQVPSAVCPERKPPGCATEDKVARHTARKSSVRKSPADRKAGRSSTACSSVSVTERNDQSNAAKRVGALGSKSSLTLPHTNTGCATSHLSRSVPTVTGAVPTVTTVNTAKTNFNDASSNTNSIVSRNVESSVSQTDQQKKCILRSSSHCAAREVSDLTTRVFEVKSYAPTTNDWKQFEVKHRNTNKEIPLSGNQPCRTQTTKGADTTRKTNLKVECGKRQLMKCQPSVRKSGVAESKDQQKININETSTKSGSNVIGYHSDGCRSGEKTGSVRCIKNNGCTSRRNRGARDRKRRSKMRKKLKDSAMKTHATVEKQQTLTKCSNTSQKQQSCTEEKKKVRSEGSKDVARSSQKVRTRGDRRRGMTSNTSKILKTGHTSSHRVDSSSRTTDESADVTWASDMRDWSDGVAQHQLVELMENQHLVGDTEHPLATSLRTAAPENCDLKVTRARVGERPSMAIQTSATEDEDLAKIAHTSVEECLISSGTVPEDWDAELTQVRLAREGAAPYQPAVGHRDDAADSSQSGHVVTVKQTVCRFTCSYAGDLCLSGRPRPSFRAPGCLLAPAALPRHTLAPSIRWRPPAYVPPPPPPAPPIGTRSPGDVSDVTSNVNRNCVEQGKVCVQPLGAYQTTHTDRMNVADMKSSHDRRQENEAARSCATEHNLSDRGSSKTSPEGSIAAGTSCSDVTTADTPYARSLGRKVWTTGESCVDKAPDMCCSSHTVDSSSRTADESADVTWASDMRDWSDGVAQHQLVELMENQHLVGDTERPLATSLRTPSPENCDLKVTRACVAERPLLTSSCASVPEDRDIDVTKARVTQTAAHNQASMHRSQSVRLVTVKQTACCFPCSNGQCLCSSTGGRARCGRPRPSPPGFLPRHVLTPSIRWRPPAYAAPPPPSGVPPGSGLNTRSRSMDEDRKSVKRRRSDSSEFNRESDRCIIYLMSFVHCYNNWLLKLTTILHLSE